MVILSKNEPSIEKLKQKIIPVLKLHHVSRAAIFGSMATGHAGESSDIDILVEFRGNKSLLDLVALKLALEDKTNRKVDLLTYRSLHPLIRRRVLRQKVTVL